LASTGIVGFIFFMLWQIFWFIEMYKREDLIAKIAIPFIVAFVVGGLTQATFTLGANLFFIMSFYTLTQLNNEVVKEKVG
jgi:O-antigen ligase